MKVTSGREAIELLFNSDRTYQDISRMKLMLGDKFEMKLIARKWVEIDPELEFRSKHRLKYMLMSTHNNVHYQLLLWIRKSSLARSTTLFATYRN